MITKMAFCTRQFIVMIVLGLTTTVYSLKCDRKLDGISSPALPLEGRFWINVATFNRTEIIDQYMPNVRYTVTIDGAKTETAGAEKFTRFLLTVENKNESLSAGTFDLTDELLTQFSDKCPSAVSESSKIPKETISVTWTSPPEGSGCVLIRAAVVENSESWFMDEGGLVRTICQDPKAIEDDPGPIQPFCCACDEAKYEVTFEGLWSRNTHPKDFPSKGWLIRFSDVIGASHTVDYRFWKYDEIASEGLQQVAEFGSTRKLESELKDQSENIRTIIKARGITYPNVTGRTFAVFRVDRKHHLMSLVSMIVPSPDWIVGVSGLELCLSDCTWIEHKELNLYPFDAGTDDGITYTSPDSPSDPPEPITRITSSYPNDTRSPFYDPSGTDMKPMAKLHLNRQRLYEKTCDNSPAPNGDTGGETPPKRHKNKPCRTTQWGEWGECPPEACDAYKLRQRSYRNPTLAKINNCTNNLTDRMICPGHFPGCVKSGDQETELNRPECALSDWSDWSVCTSTCGEGHQTRSRYFIQNKEHGKHCRAALRSLELQQTILCENPPCTDKEFEKKEDDDDDSEENGNGEDDDTDDNEDMDGQAADEPWSPEDLEVTEEWLQKCPEKDFREWSFWEPCSSTCGRGTTKRNREPKEHPYNGGDECKTQETNCTAKIISCDINSADRAAICNEPVLTGNCKGRYQRVHYDPKSAGCRFFTYTGCNGNRNSFSTIEDCIKLCINYGMNEDILPFRGIESDSQVSPPSPLLYDNGKRIDCRYTDWSDWTRCDSCRGYTYKRREILETPRNGGSRCPTKLLRKKKCHKVLNCSRESDRRRRRYRDRKSVLSYNESEHKRENERKISERAKYNR